MKANFVFPPIKIYNTESFIWTVLDSINKKATREEVLEAKSRIGPGIVRLPITRWVRTVAQKILHLFSADAFVYDYEDRKGKRRIFRNDGALYRLVLAYSSKRRQWCYVRNAEKFFGSYQCERCGAPFELNQVRLRHERGCRIVAGGGNALPIRLRYDVRNCYRPPRLITRRIEEAGVSLSDRERRAIGGTNGIIAFDCESILKERVEGEEEKKKTELISRHRPVMIVVVSNVDGERAHVFRLRKEGARGCRDMIRSFVRRLLALARRDALRNRERLASIFEKIRACKTRTRFDYWVRRLEKAEEALEGFCRKIPVLSFNGRRYDIPLLAEFLFPALIRMDSEKRKINILKRGQNYLLIESDRLRFIDMMNFCGNQSLRSILAKYTPEESKGYFPYEAARGLEDLDGPTPSYEDFEERFAGGNALEKPRRVYEDLLNGGLDPDSALRRLNLKEPPKTGPEIYADLRRTYRELNLRTLGECRRSLLVFFLPLLEFLRYGILLRRRRQRSVEVFARLFRSDLRRIRSDSGQRVGVFESNVFVVVGSEQAVSGLSRLYSAGSMGRAD